MKKLYFLLSALCFGLLPNAQTSLPTSMVADGNVLAVLRDTDKLYVGGDFHFVGPNAPYFTSVSTGTGKPNLAYARPNGTVYASVPDGSGGWFIGGNFTLVDAQARACVARINADGSLGSFVGRNRYRCTSAAAGQ